MFDAVFNERITKRLLIEATCKQLPNGRVEVKIELPTYSINVESRTGFWAKKLKNCGEIVQSLQPQSGGDSDLNELASACGQLAIAALQMAPSNNGSQTLLRSIIDNKVK